MLRQVMGGVCVVVFCAIAFTSDVCPQVPLQEHNITLTSASSNAQVAQRVAAFVGTLGHDLATLVPYDTAGEGVVHLPWRDSLPSSPEALRFFLLGSPADVQPWGTGGIAPPRSLFPSLWWLEALQPVWEQTAPRDRAQWLFRWDAIGSLVMPALARLATTVGSVSQVQRALLAFAAEAYGIAPRLRNPAHANTLAAAAAAITAEVRLAQGDTTRALRAWLDAGRFPQTRSARMAVQRAIVVAAVRQDTASWLAALTLHRLETGFASVEQYRSAAAELQAVDSQLSTLYRAYTEAHGTPPDIVPAHRLPPRPSRPALSLDTYLDRQWIGLYDRGFPIARAPAKSASMSRLIVVEYATWPGCSSCWSEDRGLQPLTRRYLTGRVIPLGYQIDEPLASSGDSLAQRFFAWYSTEAGPDTVFQGHRKVRIPKRATELVPTSDIFVDGHAIPRDSLAWTKPDGLSYYNAAVAAIDAAAQRPRQASLRLYVRAQHDRITATVQIDSIPRTHGPLAVRIILFEDTVWVRTGTIRRIYQNVVRGVAQNDTLPLGLPLPAVLPATVTYTFDVTTIQRRLQAVQDTTLSRQLYGWNSDEAATNQARSAFMHPDPRDWIIDRSRLHMLAMVQDLSTGDILHAVDTDVGSVTGFGQRQSISTRGIFLQRGSRGL